VLLRRPSFLLHLTSFFFTAAASSDFYTLSLHDALPISVLQDDRSARSAPACCRARTGRCLTSCTGRRRPGRIRSWCTSTAAAGRSEEHTSELQSRFDLVCRLLLEKKKENIDIH